MSCSESVWRQRSRWRVLPSIPDKDEVAGSIPASPTHGCIRSARGGPPRVGGYDPAVIRTLRRAALALGLAGAVAGVLRLRGSGGVPPQGGGWRELNGPDLR